MYIEGDYLLTIDIRLDEAIANLMEFLRVSKKMESIIAERSKKQDTQNGEE